MGSHTLTTLIIQTHSVLLCLVQSSWLCGARKSGVSINRMPSRSFVNLFGASFMLKHGASWNLSLRSFVYESVIEESLNRRLGLTLFYLYFILGSRFALSFGFVVCEQENSRSHVFLACE
ncbi:hypothetical protein O6H91_20G073800 [Diphasiastrum complanatum]|uniref:Uncharacterized protein n=1 Tax=Diphasiastrum complanatum TaxID=34168 RepID=A0ACC2ART8_DIPCM|nr:hypothetical protein O6H91_20G073800 [Diphasiastrum complanatum]